MTMRAWPWVGTGRASVTLMYSVSGSASGISGSRRAVVPLTTSKCSGVPSMAS